MTVPTYPAAALQLAFFWFNCSAYEVARIDKRQSCGSGAMLLSTRLGFRELKSGDPMHQDEVTLAVNATHPKHGAYFFANLCMRKSAQLHHPNELADWGIAYRCDTPLNVSAVRLYLSFVQPWRMAIPDACCHQLKSHEGHGCLCCSQQITNCTSRRRTSAMGCRCAFQPHRITFWIYMHAIKLLRKGVTLYAPPDASFQDEVSMCPAGAGMRKLAGGAWFQWQPARGWPWT